MSRPILFFDVIETLFSLQAVGERLKAVGMPDDRYDLLFAHILRDAFAISAAGRFQPFPVVARGTLEVFLRSHGLAPSEENLDKVLSGFAQLPAHADVKPALEHARAQGADIVLLTNGSVDNTETLAQRAGIADLLKDIVSIETWQVWKPHPDVYRNTARRFHLQPGEATLIAAHAWDVNGALNAGWQAVWVQRAEVGYHSAMRQPKGLANNLIEAVDIALR